MVNKRLIVFYDGWCHFCIKAMENIKRIDHLNLIQFESFRDADVVKKYQLNTEQAEKRMLSKKNNREVVYEGFDSFLLISLRVPVLWLLLPFLFLAKILGIGQIAYDFIAKRRQISVTGHCDHRCSIKKNKTDI